jgi:sugar (pentulose or hexulose) kinase
MQNLVIGIDVSTTACKAIIWDLQGNPVAEGRAEIPLRKPQANWHEQSAEEWWTALKQSLRQASAQIDRGQLAGLCICPQRETFVPVDESGNPLRNAILWMDERASGLLPFIEENLGPEKFHQITGKPLSGNLTIAKILWLREHELEVFTRTHKFLDVAAYLNHKLTGEYATGWGIADPTGLFDMQRDQWSASILGYLGLQTEQLPIAYPAGTVIGEVTPDTAQTCGLPVGLPVIAGLGDGQAAGLGANITQAGQAYLSLGTSVVSGTYSENYITTLAFRTMYGIPGAYSLETVLLGGTYTLDWFMENFSGGRSVEQLEAEIREIPPGSEGLMLVPYWNSAMNPYWDATASGITIGWRGYHGPAHLYRAILEGISFELRLHFEGVESAMNARIEHLIAMGGGSHSDLWCQMIADVSGKSIQRAKVNQATTLGAGILAAMGTGLGSNIRETAQSMTRDPEKTFVPDSRRHDLYGRLYDRIYVDLFPILKEYLSRLSLLNE